MSDETNKLDVDAVPDLPPTIPPADNEDENEGDMSDGEGTVHGSNRKRNIIIAASVAAVLLLAGAGGGYAYADMQVRKGVQAAQANAQAIDRQLTDAIKDAQTLADQTTSDMVDDPSVLDLLSDAISTAEKQQGIPDANANPYMVWTLLDAQTAYDTDANNARSVLRTVQDDAQVVTDAVNAKTLRTAQDALDKLVADAQKLYDSTDGKVQDNATRDALKTALDNAKKGDATSVDALDKLTAALNDAQTKVNDSVKAKEQADAEAQAAADAAAAAANSGSGHTGSGYGNSGYAGGYSGYTGGGSGNTGSGGGNSVDKDGDGFNDVVPWLPTDSMGNHAHYSNSDCVIFYPDGNIKDVPCS